MNTPVRVLQVCADGFWSTITADQHTNVDNDESFQTRLLKIGDFMLLCNHLSSGERNYFAEALINVLGHSDYKNREIRGTVFIGAQTHGYWPRSEVDDDAFAKLCAVAQLHQQAREYCGEAIDLKLL